MGKRKIIAETGAGQHGVATAAAAALLGLECKVFMGVEDIRRQAPNVFRMKLMGTEVIPVSAGTGTLKDAMSEAMRHWATNIRDTFYVIWLGGRASSVSFDGEEIPGRDRAGDSQANTQD